MKIIIETNKDTTTSEFDLKGTLYLPFATRYFYANTEMQILLQIMLNLTNDRTHK